MPSLVKLVPLVLLGFALSQLSACGGGGKKKGGGGAAALTSSSTATKTATRPKKPVKDSDDNASACLTGDEDDAEGSVSTKSSTATATDDDEEDSATASPASKSTTCATKTSTASNTTTSADTSSVAGGDNASWSPDPSLEDCQAEGKAWVPIGADQLPACGEPLVDWCCTEDNIKARFPGVAAQLAEKFNGYTASGLKLYACSSATDSTGKAGVKFHYASYSNGTVSYKYAFASGESAMSPSGASCPVVTSADLGISLDDTDSTATATSTTTATTTATSSSTNNSNMPTAIGTEITDASRSGLISFLAGATPAYRSYTRKDAACVTPPSGHGAANGKVKRYFNATAVDSFTTFADAQDSLHRSKSIAVLETYDSTCTQVVRIDLLAKSGSLSTASTSGWLYYAELWDNAAKTAADANDDPLAYGMGVSSCAAAGCHVVGEIGSGNSAREIDVIFSATLP